MNASPETGSGAPSARRGYFTRLLLLKLSPDGSLSRGAMCEGDDEDTAVRLATEMLDAASPGERVFAMQVTEMLRADAPKAPERSEA